MEFLKKCLLFCLGGGTYVCLELLWRGRSHITMFLLGGLCFLLIGGLNRVEPRLPFPARALLGAVICTAGELLFGLLFNRDHRIWDYSHQPLNLGGQVCLSYSLLWVALSAAALWVYDQADTRLTQMLA